MVNLWELLTNIFSLFCLGVFDYVCSIAILRKKHIYNFFFNFLRLTSWMIICLSKLQVAYNDAFNGSNEHWWQGPYIVCDNIIAKQNKTMKQKLQNKTQIVFFFNFVRIIIIQYFFACNVKQIRITHVITTY